MELGWSRSWDREGIGRARQVKGVQRQSEGCKHKGEEQDIMVGTPSQVPVPQTRSEPHPNSTSILRTPSSPDAPFTSREILLWPSMPQLASSLSATLLSPLVALATAAPNASSMPELQEAEEEGREEKTQRVSPEVEIGFCCVGHYSFQDLAPGLTFVLTWFCPDICVVLMSLDFVPVRLVGRWLPPSRLFNATVLGLEGILVSFRLLVS